MEAINRKNGINKLIYRKGMETQMYRMDFSTQLMGRKSGTNGESRVDLYALPCEKRERAGESFI